MPETWPFIFLLLLTIAAFARTAAKTAWTYVFLVITFTGFAIYTSRMIPLWAIVVVPITTKTVGDWMEQDLTASRFREIDKNIVMINSSSNGVVWFILLVIGTTILFKSGTTIDLENKGNVFDEKFFPVQAIDWLNQNHPDGHMFNEFDWGGYLLLEVSPRQQIFMDGHTHIYGETLTREYETVISLADGWQDVLDKYQVEWVILRTGSPLVGALENINWKIAYQDDTATVLVHR